ncbi:amidohydrolase [Puniceicoccales bacterium CK1056]|uniref:Amidohydrolase n=1 Tax=Oceanipulchritudo coccoides TaxID=2706888 RepID=A0A6B2M620_9BACT|nr:amidohydrolase [Oceanipulchritudo coccoides]NDV63120.1 amidohydrolase [Oceanipulchritudo coccoides]
MPQLKELFDRLDGLIQADAKSIQDVRRYLHAHPEPSGEETRTTAFIADQVESLGLNFRIGPDGRGLIVDFPGPNCKRYVALRADIDALRLQDEKTVSYRSRENNLMHACGHDAHTAMALGAIKALSKVPDALPEGIGWRCLFQPAEESATGAKDMISWNALDRVEAIVALHVDPALHAGQIGYREGSLTACCEEFEILVEGLGGHGARPHTTFDPIAAATQIVQTVYSVLPRSVDSRDPLVVSFGVIQGGINPNVIPESAQLRGTIRSTDSEHSRVAKQRIREVIDGVAQICQVRTSFSIAYSLPPVKNDPVLTGLCKSAVHDLVGDEGMVYVDKPSMGGEDFAWYLNECAGCMLRLGVGTPLKPVRHLHSSCFDVNESALPIGAKALTRSVVQIARHLENAD